MTVYLGISGHVGYLEKALKMTLRYDIINAHGLPLIKLESGCWEVSSHSLWFIWKKKKKKKRTKNKPCKRLILLKGSCRAETLEIFLYFSICSDKFSILCDSTQRMEIKLTGNKWLSLIFRGSQEVRGALGMRSILQLSKVKITDSEFNRSAPSAPTGNIYLQLLLILICL